MYEGVIAFFAYTCYNATYDLLRFVIQRLSLSDSWNFCL
jgi:hypothetical protein